MTSLLEFFPVRVYSGEIGFRKPDRQIFQLALRQLGCRAHNTVFVGDVVKNDIVGARRLGMITVLKQPPGPSRIHPIAHYVIHRISELIEILPLIRLELSHRSHLRHASIRDRRLR